MSTSPGGRARSRRDGAPADGPADEPPSLEEQLTALIPMEGWALPETGGAMVSAVSGSASPDESIEDPASVPSVHIDDLEEWRNQRIAEVYANQAANPPKRAPVHRFFMYGAEPGGVGRPESGVIIDLGPIGEGGRAPPPTHPGEVVLTTENEVVRIRTWGPDAPSADAVADELQRERRRPCAPSL